VTILARFVGWLCCWLWGHLWASSYGEPGHAGTLLAYTERCHRCGAERDINRDL
jgi:hypothetical protein